MGRLFLIILFGLMILRASAQEYCFSQYYLDKLSINPAFAAVGGYSEVGAIFRDQWPGIDDGYKIFGAEYQQKLPSISSAVGARAYGDISGGAYKTAAFSAIYAYDFHLTYNIKCSVGIEAGFLSRSLNQSNLVYYSMIDQNTGQTAALNENVEYSKYSNISFATGAIVYTKKILAGIGVYRLACQTLSGEPNNIPVMLTGIVNYKVVIGSYTRNANIEEIFLVPSINLSHSALADMLMPGVYFSGHKLLLGIAWRYQRSDYQTNAIVTSIGFNFGKMELGLGHDFEVGPIATTSKGSTEVGIKYKFENSQKNKGSSTILCPAF